MQNFSYLLSDWTDELNSTLIENNSFCVALFSTNGNLLFANEAMKHHLIDESKDSLINPTFNKLLTLDYSNILIFKGFLTLGDYSSVNTSILSNIFRKNDKILILGGVNAIQLQEQNANIHKLNQENLNLQRKLIKEKLILENILSKLNDANVELKKLNEDKDSFMSILAHDLRSPFSALIGFSDLLLDDLDGFTKEEIEEQLKILNKTAYQTFYLLNDLLSWIKSHSGQLSYNPEKVNLKDVCLDLVKSIQNQAVLKNIRIIPIKCENVIVKADLNMLKTILRNLVSNAIKYTEKNGEITVSSAINNDYSIITVADNGIGIDRETISNLWKFRQNQSKIGTSGEKGTGFGLMLCKEFVEKHNGKIWVESQPGHGSQFKFTIPLFNDSNSF